MQSILGIPGTPVACIGIPAVSNLADLAHGAGAASTPPHDDDAVAHLGLSGVCDFNHLPDGFMTEAVAHVWASYRNRLSQLHIPPCAVSERFVLSTRCRDVYFDEDIVAIRSWGRPIHHACRTIFEHRCYFHHKTPYAYALF